jgi:hypothetical protein
MTTITITRTLDDDFWIDAENQSNLSDAELIDTVKGDMEALLDGAIWTVTRNQSFCSARLCHVPPTPDEFCLLAEGHNGLHSWDVAA